MANALDLHSGRLGSSPTVSTILIFNNMQDLIEYETGIKSFQECDDLIKYEKGIKSESESLVNYEQGGFQRPSD